MKKAFCLVQFVLSIYRSWLLRRRSRYCLDGLGSNPSEEEFSIYNHTDSEVHLLLVQWVSGLPVGGGGGCNAFGAWLLLVPGCEWIGSILPSSLRVYIGMS